MKKVFLLSIATALSMSVFAQKATTNHRSIEANNGPIGFFSFNNSNARTTSVGSSDTLSNIAVNDTAQLYTAGSTLDSGLISGMDAYGDMGYAERFDFAGTDSSLKVTGVIALFGGTVSSSSTKAVKFYTWTAGAQSANSGFPNVALDSVSVPFTALGITTGNFGISVNIFTTPTPYLNNSFFVGCTINYDMNNFGGDTIGLATSQIGDRSSVEYNVIAGDTVINNQSVSMYNDGTWNDNWFSNFQAPYDFYLFPIVTVGSATASVNGVTKNGFTFFGTYPNPATDNTNVKFSLANSADVTIVVTDMAGHTVNTISQTNLTAGTHIIPVATANMPAGDYICLVRTAAGAGMASKFTVIK